MDDRKQVPRSSNYSKFLPRKRPALIIGPQLRIHSYFIRSLITLSSFKVEEFGCPWHLQSLQLTLNVLSIRFAKDDDQIAYRFCYSGES